MGIRAGAGAGAGWGHGSVGKLIYGTASNDKPFIVSYVEVLKTVRMRVVPSNKSLTHPFPSLFLS